MSSTSEAIETFLQNTKLKADRDRAQPCGPSRRDARQVHRREAEGRAEGLRRTELQAGHLGWYHHPDQRHPQARGHPFLRPLRAQGMRRGKWLWCGHEESLTTSVAHLLTSRPPLFGILSLLFSLTLSSPLRLLHPTLPFRPSLSVSLSPSPLPPPSPLFRP